MNPFGRKNDSPKNPLEYIRQNGTPMNPDIPSNVPPGGRVQTSLGLKEGDRMQYATEDGKSYEGSMVYNNSSESGKVLGRISNPK